MLGKGLWEGKDWQIAKNPSHSSLGADFSVEEEPFIIRPVNAWSCSCGNTKEKLS